MSEPMTKPPEAPSPNTAHCPRCGFRLMGPDPDGELVIKGTRVLRLRGSRFQAKCGRCKEWAVLPVMPVGGQ